MTRGLYRRNFWPITLRDLAVVGYVFLWEWSSIPGLIYVVGHYRRLWRKRRTIQVRVRAGEAELERWFC